MKRLSSITARLLMSNKISYIITAAVILCATSSGNVVISNGNYTWLLAIMSPFFFVYYDFPKLVHLGAGKRDYLLSCIAAYLMLAVASSLMNTLIHLLIDPLYNAETVINLMDACLWTENGIVSAFFSQTVFLFLVMMFLHLLLSIQRCWYGWLADVLIIAVISIFTPIESLRHLLSSFFHLIMINGSTFTMISSDLALIALSALLSLLALRKMEL